MESYLDPPVPICHTFLERVGNFRVTTQPPHYHLKFGLINAYGREL